MLGTFIGGFEGQKSGLNCTIQNGGVSIGAGGWAELANVRSEGGSAGLTNLTVIGGRIGTLSVQINFLTSSPVVFGSANTNVTVEVDFLEGGNVVTLFQVEGEPWVDAIVVG